MKNIMASSVLILSAVLFLSGCGRNLPTENTSSNETLAAARTDAYAVGVGYNGWWGWGGWGSGAVTAFGDYARGIGIARYLTAQAYYQDALTLQEYARANAYAKLMHSMWIDLRRLDSEKYRIAKARKALDAKARSLNGIALGKLNYAKSALLYFSNLPGFATLPIVSKYETVGPFAADTFVPKPDRTHYVDGKLETVKTEMEAFNGGSVAEFVSWIAVKGYDVKVNTAVAGAGPSAWQILMAVRSQLQEQIALTDAALKETAKADTADIIKIWGESIWGNYGYGLLKDYRVQVEAAEKLRGRR